MCVGSFTFQNSNDKKSIDSNLEPLEGSYFLYFDTIILESNCTEYVVKCVQCCTIYLHCYFISRTRACTSRVWTPRQGPLIIFAKVFDATSCKHSSRRFLMLAYLSYITRLPYSDSNGAELERRTLRSLQLKIIAAKSCHPSSKFQTAKRYATRLCL